MSERQKRPFTLYWSNLELFEGCPQAFLWGRGWGDIDVGGGPGKKKPSPVRDSRHHAIMGQAVGKAVEDFYNLELYRNPVGLRDRMSDIAEKEMSFLLTKDFVDWREAPSRSEMTKIVRDGASNFLTTAKFDKLIGAYAKAEVNFICAVDERTPIGGRADIVLQRDDTGISILDGKNSQSKGKYTNPDQLRWYALCYRLVHGVMPHRLGFVYFRYPADPEKNQSGVDWIEVTEADVQGLAGRAVSALESMRAEEFPATPSPTTCKFCDYQTVCPARIEQKAKRARGGASKEADDVLLAAGGGMLEIGFGDLASGSKSRKRG